ncbi:MauE/DoxX family redox-associated membrane protein [Sphingobacterium cellulitidis]|uniref:MauE/DoxX family redox-associated membrane protein n=1 Tax=Sphingobacterium cellulitidis TaxID=1768011 RepID=UPI000B93B5E6|nr:hypothetical protein CHT99_11625 [Sphingobacterium cellulitidis]
MRTPSTNTRIKSVLTGTKYSFILYHFTLTVIYGYAFLLIYTGSDKLQHINKFIDVIQKIPRLNNFASMIGWGIPIIELLLGISLLFSKGNFLRGILMASVVLMCIFTIYLGLVLLFKMEENFCSCGGVISSLDWSEHLIFNIFCLIIGMVGLKNLRIINT